MSPHRAHAQRPTTHRAVLALLLVLGLVGASVPLAASSSTAAPKATVVALAKGKTRAVPLSGTATLYRDMRVAVSANKLPRGGAAVLTVSGRRVGGLDYGARVTVRAGTVPTIATLAGSTAGRAVPVRGTFAKAGARVYVRVQVTGSKPTTVRVKMWPVGKPEPKTWQAATTNAAARLQVRGPMGVSASLARRVANGAVTFRFDSLVAGDLTPKPAPAPRPTTTPAPTPAPTSAPTPTPTPTAAPTAPPTLEPTTDAAPGPQTTGVPAGTRTTVHDGNLTITTDNTVIDGWDIRGYVKVQAKNVVIRNSFIRGTAVPQSTDLLRVQGDAYSAVVEDSTLVAQTRSPNVDGVKGWNFTLRRVEIANVVDPVHIHGDNVVVQRSWLHDNSVFAQDPNWGGNPSHADSIQIQRGRNITIADNAISGANNAALMLTQDSGAIAALKVSGNFIDGGACSINIKRAADSPGLTIADNTFGRGQRVKDCAVIAPSEWLFEMRDNAWSDGGTVGRTRG